MSDNEKLRALLAEARAELHSIEALTVHPGMHHGKDAARLLSVLKRIDAALAEPVDDYDVDADLRLHKEDRLRLRAENLRLERERDEARAEVERLRFELRKVEAYSAGPTWLTHQESIAAAYQRGAEAMREAAAKEVFAFYAWSKDNETTRTDIKNLAEMIDALPVAGATCKICGRHDQPHDPCDCAGEDKK